MVSIFLRFTRKRRWTMRYRKIVRVLVSLTLSLLALYFRGILSMLFSISRSEVHLKMRWLISAKSESEVDAYISNGLLLAWVGLLAICIFLMIALSLYIVHVKLLIKFKNLQNVNTLKGTGQTNHSFRYWPDGPSRDSLLDCICTDHIRDSYQTFKNPNTGSIG